MDAGDLVEFLAVASAVGGLVLTVVAWRRARRLDARRRTAHPASSPPVSLTIDTSSGAPRWRIHVDERWPTVGLDILTYRRAGTDDAWHDEPLMRPVTVPPGESALLDTELPDATGPFDVVVGWTVHRPDGPNTGSATMVAPSNVATVTAASTTVHPYRLVYPIVAVALLAATVLAVVGLDDAPTSADDSAAGGPGSATSTTDVASPTVATTAPSTTPPATTISTSPTTTAPTTAPTTTSTPVSTSTTTTAPTTLPDGPRVEITSRVEDCRFGQDCVIASFRVVDFVGSGRYVCEFDDGSRFEFRYAGDGADDACARSGPAPTITIEVDGVRSATVGR